jgi:hypothetical protein
MASSYDKRKAEIKALRKAVDQARRECATESEAVNLLANVAKSLPGGVEALIECYKQIVREDNVNLSSAIEKAMFNPQTLTPRNDSQLVANAVFSDSAKNAVDGYVEPDGELTKRREKVAGDIKESGIPRRTQL